MGLGMSLSGLYNLGHDVGGFSGDKPDAELLVRWVQNGVMHPRFTIHSWNDDATVNEPWMYPAATPAVREAINLRYRLLPYFYTLLWQACADDEPMLRPTFLDHEQDARTFGENDDFLIGRDLLVASVVEPGQRRRSVYLPDNGEGWYCFYSGQWFGGGQTVTLAAPLERLPLLVRAGAALPLSQRLAHVDVAADDRRELRLFPLKGCGASSGLLFEDDGESDGWRQGDALWLQLGNALRQSAHHAGYHDGRAFPPGLAHAGAQPAGRRNARAVGERRTGRAFYAGVGVTRPRVSCAAFGDGDGFHLAFHPAILQAGFQQFADLRLFGGFQQLAARFASRCSRAPASPAG